MRIVLRVFYKNIHLVGMENIPEKGPVILAATHPNSFMDDVVLGAFLKRNVIFLARGDVFRKAWAKFLLNAMHVHPIFRGRDTQKEVGKNLNSFTFYKNHLKKGQTILIHPEGLCVHEKRIRPLKKGMGRIAFDAEEESNWDLGIQIVPISLNYTNAPFQGETLMVQVGRAIATENYKELYQENPAKAYAQLAKDVFPVLEENGVVQDKGTEEVSEILLTTARNNESFKHSRIVNRNENPFLLDKNTADKVNLLFTHPNWKEYEKVALNFKKNLEYHGLIDKTLVGKPKDFSISESIAVPFILLWSWPLFLIPRWTEKLIRSIEFRASVLLGIAYLIFGLKITLFLVLIFMFIGWWGLLLLPLSLLVAFGAKRIMGMKEERSAYRKWNKLSNHKKQELLEMRKELVSKLLE